MKRENPMDGPVYDKVNKVGFDTRELEWYLKSRGKTLKEFETWVNGVDMK